MKNTQHRWFLGAGVVSAVVASLCCLGPVVMLGLGLGSFVAASWFAQWRPVFLGVTFALLAAAWYFALRRRPACEGDACASPGRRSRGTLVVLSIATVAAGGFAAYPFLAGRAAAAMSDSSTFNTTTAADLRALNVRIPSMDCEACAMGIAATLRREPGIVSADVTYATKTATVRFDPHTTDTDKIIAAIGATGFPAEAPTEEKP